MDIRAQAKIPLSLDDAAPSLERRGGIAWGLVSGSRHWMVQHEQALAVCAELERLTPKQS
jgi:hypothetical protein